MQVNKFSAEIFKIGEAIVSKKGNIVYSTGGIKPTFLDSFVSSVEKVTPNKTKMLNNTSKNRAIAIWNSVEIEKKLASLIKGLKGHAEISYRVKGLPSSMDKNIKEIGNRQESFFDYISKYLNPLSNTANANKTASELDGIRYKNFMESFSLKDDLKSLSNNKIVAKSLVGDMFGGRIIVKNEAFINKNGVKVNSYEEITKRLCTLHDKGKIKILSVENYHGKGIKGYASEVIKETFAATGVPVSTKVKTAGYTRMNINVEIDGVLTEIQIGGRHTTPFGEGEHLLYDMRQNKTLHLHKYTPEQKVIAQQIKRSVRKVYKNEKAKQAYEKYLNSVWAYLRNAESNSMDIQMSQLPKIPKGLPEVLDAQNIFKLAPVKGK